jgi:Flp pilus assembly protein TadB
MSALTHLVVFAVGFIMGAGAMLLYFQFSMYRQIGQFEEQMEGLMDMEDMEFPEMDEAENKKEEEDGS